jgi:putative ABC transport system permease protein
MLRMSLSNLWFRKRLLRGVTLAILLGVAFLGGTLTLSDSLSGNIDAYFVKADAGIDVLVRSATSVSSSPGTMRGLIDASLLSTVRSIPGVVDAQPVIQAFGELVGRNHVAVTGMGPLVAGNWIPDPALNPYQIAEGRAPIGDDEVVVNRGAAKSGGLSVGATTTVLTPAPVRVTIVGIATFGGADAYGGTTFVAFTFHGAQLHLLGTTDRISSIDVRAAPGISQDALLSRVREVLPPGVEAISGAQLLQENVDAVNTSFINGLRAGLSAFAVVALLVAMFTIYNTFSIVNAQRTRESALLRILGATRRQLLWVIALEAAIVGVVAAGLGVLGGIGLAALLNSAFGAFGIILPSSGITVQPASVAIPLVVGVGITVIASLIPALRASRVAPVRALQATAAEASHPAPVRGLAGVLVLAAGIDLVVAAGLGGASGTLVGVGAVVVIAGAVVVGPHLLRPFVRVLGASLGRMGGIPAALARDSALRNPRRTSSTASALLVGVTVVTLIGAFATSLQQSISGNLSASLSHADVVVSAGGNGFAGLSPSLLQRIARLPVVDNAVGLGHGTVIVNGTNAAVTFTDPAAFSRVVDVKPISGDLSLLGTGEVAVSQHTAQTNGWQVGQALSLTFADGAQQTLRVAAVYSNTSVVGDYLLSAATWALHAPQVRDSSIFVALRPGPRQSQGQAAISQLAQQFGSPVVQDRTAYITSATKTLSALVTAVYAMLTLAILIALLGIANTLSLSMHERTREIGLLRAVGETRPQVRAMIRDEALLIALFGTVGGVCIGLFLGWGLVSATSTSLDIGTFSVSPLQVLAIVIVGALSGVLASLLPARRAARLPVVGAIAVE